jgi:hypothetical protein
MKTNYKLSNIFDNLYQFLMDVSKVDKKLYKQLLET